MKIYSVVFSPTGGTKKAADMIAGEFCGEKTDISLVPESDEYSHYKFNKDDLCIIAVPSFGGRVPGIAAIRLREMMGNQARCILVCVYGNRAYDDTLLELRNTAKEAGFRPVAAIAVIAEHSVMRCYAQGRPDSADQTRLKEFAAQIRYRIESEEVPGELKVPGAYPYREYGSVPFVPKPDQKCTSCGVCAAECPTGAISHADTSMVDKNKCIACMRCVSVCPKQARNINRLLLKAAAVKLSKACRERKEPELFM